MEEPVRTKVLCSFFVLILFCMSAHSQFRDHQLLILTSPDGRHISPQIGISSENLFRNKENLQNLTREMELFRILPLFPAGFWETYFRGHDSKARVKSDKTSDRYLSQFLLNDAHALIDDKPDISMEHLKSLNFGLKRSVFRRWRYYTTTMWRIRMARAPEGKKLLREVKMDRTVR